MTSKLTSPDFKIIRNLSTERNAVFLTERGGRKEILKTDKKEESRILEKLSSGLFPALTGVFRTGENRFLTEEYREGVTFSEYIQEHGKLDGPELLRTAEKALRCLEALRKCHIVHGDIKPSHFLMTPDGLVSLIDFDTAFFDTQRDKKPPLGTKGYSAPECYNGEYSYQSDLYSLGAVLFYLASGKRPPEVSGWLDRALFRIRLYSIRSETARNLIRDMTRFNPEKRTCDLKEWDSYTGDSPL